jgi:serine/threonine-protein kinase RsbW/stage II sporulation protein AB (anti-sigma F factor)
VLYDRSLPAEPANVGTLRRELNGALAPVDLGKQRRSDIALVVSEALTNAAVHAYVGMVTGPVAVNATLSGLTLRITVRDRGRGMIPRTDSPGLGLGVGLLGRLSDVLEISSPDGEGTEICVRFNL